MAYSGKSQPGRLTPPPKSPRKIHTAPAYSQMPPRFPLVPPNKPQVLIGQLEQQKQVRYMPGEIKQKVKLIWRKQQDTINNYVTYFDNLDGPCELLWDKLSTHYSVTTDLTCGRHMGCLVLSDRDLSSETQSFLVEENSYKIQSIQLSINNSDVKERGKQTTNSKLVEKMREEGELRLLKEERKKLLKDNSLLSSKLEEQKKENNQQLDNYKKDIFKLREELNREKQAAAGERNQAKITQLKLESQLRNIQPSRLDEDTQDVIWKVLETPGSKKQVINSQTPKLNYINIEPNKQYEEYYIEYKELEKSKMNLNKEKQKSDKEKAIFLDLLHGEKIALTQELAQTKKQLMDSEKEIVSLKQASSITGPPIPSRSHKAVSPFSNSSQYKSSA